MMDGHYLIAAGDESWRVICVAEDGSVRGETLEVANENDATSRAQAARELLLAMGYAEQPIVLAVASRWCLCARIETQDLSRVGRHQAIGYRLEEHLPISAEEMIADCVDLGEDEALGVCGEYAKLRQIVDALENTGISVRHICPQALLAAAYAVDAHAELDAVLIGGAGYDWIVFEQGKPAVWAWLADDAELIAQRLAESVKGRDQRLQLAVVGDDSPARHLPGVSDQVERVTLDVGDAEHAAARQAIRMLDEQATAWIDLRCDRLAAADQYERYRRPLGLFAAAMMVLLVCIIAVAQWRGARYEHQRQELQAQQVEIFKQAMPGQRVPVYVRGRLQSEQRKLAGLGGAESNEATRVTSALVHLQQVLGGLPTDVPFRILDLSIEPELIRIDGQAAGHVNAEQLVTALRQTGTYDVEPAKTQLLKDKGVSFLFTAKPHAPSAEKGAAP